nr:tetratricopeptide repeat protein [Bacteroidota bacterium]
MRYPLLILLICTTLFSGFSQPEADSIENVLRHTTDLNNRFELLYQLARLYSRTNPEKCLEYAQQAVEAANETADLQLQAKALNGLAIANYLQGYNSIAIRYFERLVLIYKDLYQQSSNDTEIGLLLANTLSNVGICYKNTGANNEALECYIKALEIIDDFLPQSGDNPKIPDIYIHILNNIGILQMNLSEYEKALTSISTALTESRENNFTYLTALSLNNLGLVNIEKQQYKEAEKNYLEAVRINSDLGDSITLGGNYNNLGLIFEEQEKWDIALNYYKQSLAISKRLGYNWGTANTLANIGKIYSRVNQFSDATKHLKEALSMAMKTDDKNLNQKMYLYLYELYNRKNDKSMALSYYLQYTQLKDSIFTEEKAGQIVELEIKYETEKKEKENLALHMDNEIKQLKIERKTRQVVWLIVASAGLLVFVIVISVLFRQKDTAYRNIVRKNQEIVAIEKQLHKSTLKAAEGEEQRHSDRTAEGDPGNESKEILIESLEKYLNEEKPYLSPDISLTEICKQINTNRSYLSNVINERYHQNFNAWINNFRIKEARQLLSDGRYDHISIEGIGEMAGFNSKATFHSNFKSSIGVTPSYYRQKRS